MQRKDTMKGWTQECSSIKRKKDFKVKKRKKMVEKPTTTAKCVANELVNDYINNNCYYDSIKQFNMVGYTASEQEALVELSEERIVEIVEWLKTCEFMQIKDDAYYYIFDCKGCSLEQVSELHHAIWDIACTVSYKATCSIGDIKVAFDGATSLGVYTSGKTIIAGFIKSEVLGAFLKESKAFDRALGGNK